MVAFMTYVYAQVLDKNVEGDSVLSIPLRNNYAEFVNNICTPAQDYSIDSTNYMALLDIIDDDKQVAKDALFIGYDTLLQYDEKRNTYHTMIDCTLSTGIYDAVEYHLQDAQDEYTEKISSSNSKDLWSEEMGEQSYDGIPTSGSSAIVGVNHVWEDIQPTKPDCEETYHSIRERQRNKATGVLKKDWIDKQFFPNEDNRYDAARKDFAPRIVAQTMLTEWCGYQLYLWGMERNNDAFEDVFNAVMDSNERVNAYEEAYSTWRNTYRYERERSYKALKIAIYYYQQYVHNFGKYVTERNMSDASVMVRRELEYFTRNVRNGDYFLFVGGVSNECLSEGNTCEKSN